ncbi:hypothetical protein [Polaromonas sp.]|uniref:hypothetical protein n=1 Tax=Polaromonas sp. TaxID=1869339 RepID=UPI0018215F74|nr:hypothetical protein [Polaromonas sp.]NMM05962.1 hypothetical protein [Polaromonas sp.]
MTIQRLSQLCLAGQMSAPKVAAHFRDLLRQMAAPRKLTLLLPLPSALAHAKAAPIDTGLTVAKKTFAKGDAVKVEIGFAACFGDLKRHG